MLRWGSTKNLAIRLCRKNIFTDRTMFEKDDDVNGVTTRER